MCRRVTCRTCNKPDWAGCGAHIESVLGDVPKPERCDCRETGKRQQNAGLGAFLSSLFGGGKG